MNFGSTDDSAGGNVFDMSASNDKTGSGGGSNLGSSMGSLVGVEEDEGIPSTPCLRLERLRFSIGGLLESFAALPRLAPWLDWLRDGVGDGDIEGRACREWVRLIASVSELDTVEEPPLPVLKARSSKLETRTRSNP